MKLLVLTASIVVAVLACSSDALVSPDSPPFHGDVTIPAGSELACTAEGQPDLTPLLARLGVDYIEIRQGYGLDGAVSPRTLDEAGTPCGTAKDRATCQAALAMIRPGGLADGGIGTRSVVLVTGTSIITTKGDTVTELRDVRSLVTAFGGAIDTKEEATLVLSFAGIGLRCADAKNGAVWRVGDTFEAIGNDDSCTETYREHLRVRPDGSFDVLERELTRREDVIC